LNFDKLNFGELNLGELNLGELRRKCRHDPDHNVAGTPCDGMKPFGEKREEFTGAGPGP
jgi:hypothetical protein